MAHDVILGAIKRHLDDLKLRNPRLYAAEERDLMKQEHRLDYEVAQTPIAIPADRRYELHVKRAERNQYR
jgi:hypothetical protein